MANAKRGNTVLIVVVILVVIGLAAWYFSGKGKSKVVHALCPKCKTPVKCPSVPSVTDLQGGSAGVFDGWAVTCLQNSLTKPEIDTTKKTISLGCSQSYNLSTTKVHCADCPRG